MGLDREFGITRFHSWFAALLFMSMFLSVPQSACATAIASSNIALFSFQITPKEGTLQLFGSWAGEAFAQASNSLGQLASTFDSTVGNFALADTVGVSFAEGHGLASALVLGVTATASSNVNIPGTTTTTQASSVGLGTLFNSFIITGGIGSVDVAFSVHIAGAQHVVTDKFGLRARTTTIFDLELNGTPILFHDSIDDIGPNFEITSGFDQTLSTTLNLQFFTPYFLLGQVDSESFGLNVPGPGTITLVLTGLGVFVGFAGRRITREKTYALKS